MKKIVELTATENDELLNVIEQSANDNGFEIESVDDVLAFVKIVADALKYMGIEAHVKWVDDDDDDDDEEEDEDEEEDMESIIYDCDGHRGISADDACLLMKCVAKVMQKQFGGAVPEEVVELLALEETLRIAEEWDIEVVDTGDE